MQILGRLGLSLMHRIVIVVRASSTMQRAGTMDEATQVSLRLRGNRGWANCRQSVRVLNIHRQCVPLTRHGRHDPALRVKGPFREGFLVQTRRVKQETWRGRIWSVHRLTTQFRISRPYHGNDVLHSKIFSQWCGQTPIDPLAVVACSSRAISDDGSCTSTNSLLFDSAIRMSLLQARHEAVHRVSRTNNGKSRSNPHRRLYVVVEGVVEARRLLQIGKAKLRVLQKPAQASLRPFFIHRRILKTIYANGGGEYSAFPIPLPHAYAHLLSHDSGALHVDVLVCGIVMPACDTVQSAITARIGDSSSLVMTPGSDFNICFRGVPDPTLTPAHPTGQASAAVLVCVILDLRLRFDRLS